MRKFSGYASNRAGRWAEELAVDRTVERMYQDKPLLVVYALRDSNYTNPARAAESVNCADRGSQGSGDEPCNVASLVVFSGGNLEFSLSCGGHAPR